jgi:hypothetical protein
MALGACDDDEPATPSDAPPPGSSTTAEASPADARERFDRLLAEALASQGLGRAVARCAVGRLNEAIAVEQLEAVAAELSEGGEVPGELLEAAFDAGRDCAP